LRLDFPPPTPASGGQLLSPFLKISILSLCKTKKDDKKINIALPQTRVRCCPPLAGVGGGVTKVFLDYIVLLKSLLLFPNHEKAAGFCHPFDISVFAWRAHCALPGAYN
jgi:hypothetical protein